jgi:hypothetical protein
MTMGGGLVQVAGMMVIFGYGMSLIRPVAYLTNIFVYGAAALRNDQAGLVMKDHVRVLLPWAVVGILAGYFIGNWIGDTAVYYLVGCFAALMAVKALHEIFADESDEILIREPGKDMTLDGRDDDFIESVFSEPGARKQASNIDAHGPMLGLPMGLISGILGISGGVVEVPLQRYIGKIPLRNAIANSSVLVFWASLSGTLISILHGVGTGLIHWQAPVVLAMIMIPGAYVGGMFGARLMKQLPSEVLKGTYAAIMVAIAVKILLLA